MTPDHMTPDQEADRLRGLILSFCASLTLCDHMGDVSNEVGTLLQMVGVEEAWDDWDELGQILARRGVKTLGGTELSIEPAE